MAVIDLNDIVRITAVMNIDGIHDVNNVYHYRAGAASVGDAQDFMDDVATEMNAIYTLINADISDRLNYVTIEGFNITQNVILPSTDWPVLVDGGTSTEMLPEMNAISVFFPTTRPKTRASKFLAGYTEPANDGGAILAAVIPSLESYGARVLAGFVADTAVLGYGAWNKDAVRFTPAIRAVVPARFRTQRRRRFGVGA